MYFLEYTGKLEFKKEKKEYVFKMKDKKKNIIEKYVIDIPIPVIDINFKQFFASNPGITKNLLN